MLRLASSPYSIVCAGVLLLGCSSSLVGKNSNAVGSARARLDVRIADQSAGFGRDRGLQPVEMTLVNQSDVLLWANAQMISASSYFPHHAEVDLQITGPSGPLTFSCKSDSEPATVGAYVLLRPGGRLTRSVELWCYGHFDELGTYTARARYHDGNPQAPLPPTGAQHLSEEVLSEPSVFHVVGN